MMTAGSLFSGIGGIDLGLERAGWKVVWQAETAEYASRVLAKHWPAVPNLGDVTKVDWDGVERPDLVAGGFPCQPVSQAGRRLAQDDARWLWPEYARCVRHLRPAHVLVENVPGLLVRGVGDVLGDLAEMGYDTEWTCLPAAAVGAPHLRWRVFLVAHSDRGCLHRSGPDGGDGREVPAQGEQRVVRRSPGGEGALADATSSGRRRRQAGVGVGRHQAVGIETVHLPAVSGEPLADPAGQGRERPVNAQPGAGRAPMERAPDPVFGGRRLPERGPWWDVEPGMGRVVNGVPARLDRLRCLGNAVVPQVAEYVGRCLADHVLSSDGQSGGDDERS